MPIMQQRDGRQTTASDTTTRQGHEKQALKRTARHHRALHPCIDCSIGSGTARRAPRSVWIMERHQRQMYCAACRTVPLRTLQLCKPRVPTRACVLVASLSCHIRTHPPSPLPMPLPQQLRAFVFGGSRSRVRVRWLLNSSSSCAHAPSWM